MSILSGLEIQKRLNQDIFISDFHESRLNPNSYNLRLHDELLVYDTDLLDMKADNPTRRIKIPNEGLVLQPNTLYLGRTMEFTKTKNGLVPMLEGRSSIGRLGLAIHVTAGFGDVDFGGTWTLELFTIHPVKIYPFVEIGQIYYHQLIGEYQPYVSGKYQGQQDIRSSQMYKDFNKATCT